MQNALPQTDKEIADYFNAAANKSASDMEILGVVVTELLQSGTPLSNKAIISKLIHRLELETDVVSLDIYRQLLELVVHKTPDDFTV
ncbi:biofilm/acid-resistance regulator YmgB/AriR [Pantoea sp. LMR881]|uniref:biofilm/acid-resistance regulator YmgB/AriR n=1 Tax=Pantoea sp. LMR881 TaxID=3014336 RepID=UPI0022AF29B3|nr:biofilm/acid-resistance regulator YmgB/AriR [Pantoea sp. LMR881]MCZ4058753.1 biofilm/acid-resistance regulator YmgB/AriR [Pantoea sp. LMR881]